MSWWVERGDRLSKFLTEADQVPLIRLLCRKCGKYVGGATRINDDLLWQRPELISNAGMVEMDNFLDGSTSSLEELNHRYPTTSIRVAAGSWVFEACELTRHEQPEVVWWVCAITDLGLEPLSVAVPPVGPRTSCPRCAIGFSFNRSDIIQAAANKRHKLNLPTFRTSVDDHPRR